MLVEDRVHERLVELVVTAKLTAPVNPFRGETAIAEVPLALTVAVTDDGLLEIAKSCTWTVTVAEWDREPLVLVTVAR
jgi:hypothetical protein